MGTRNVFMLKTHIGSINLSFANGFVYENMIWALASLWVFFCNYVLYSFGLLLRYIFRFRIEDRKREHLVPHDLLDHPKRNQIEDPKVDGLAEELATLLFPIFENFHVGIEESEGETECPVLWVRDYDVNIHQDAKKLEGETECSVLKEKITDMNEGANKIEGETDYSVFKEKDSIHEDGKRKEAETEGSVSCLHKDFNKIDENETDSSVSKEDDPNFPQINRENFEEEKTEKPFFFTFQQNYSAANVSDNIFSCTEYIAKMEFSEHNLKEGVVAQEEEKEHFVQDQRNITSNFSSGQILQINAFGESDPSDDDDDVLHDNSRPSDFGSELCCIKTDDLVTHQILSSSHSCEGIDFKSLTGIQDERVEDRQESQHSCEASHSPNFHLEMEEPNRGTMEKTKETMWEDNLDESDFDEEEEEDEDEDDFEWEHDEVVEQLRMELKNARQGGLATILEEEDDDKIESPKVVEDLMPLKIEEKIQFKDHIVEIQKVYRCYAEKVRKLDVLNYQTMHAIGLFQLKDPLKLMSTAKSSVQSGKPLLSQNLWPRKAQKHICDPILKYVEELHGDLETVYVGQVCLSWEILCWQHKKVEELKQYDSQWPRSYNLVAGEFQLFQVLMQRFLEDEPFQGPRIQNYVRNRCVIRNLLQVPVIKDDNTKNKKLIKSGEEYAIDGEMLARIMKESMRVFWEFVRADKHHENVNCKVSHQIGIDVKDPAISELLGNVRTELQKKERKLKDIVRSGNCIVRKFQKHHEDQIQLDQKQLLAQVGLRLVLRGMLVRIHRKWVMYGRLWDRPSVPTDRCRKPPLKVITGISSLKVRTDLWYLLTDNSEKLGSYNGGTLGAFNR
ncbi:hypothetical protein Fmac_005835 [Flemingia macrophylla]|uniref:Ribosomal protein L34Ae n=1 Tax=Flemingia macrophylla TaxID=520843 RepID=A0ABD1N8W3_9FABA